MGEPVFVETDLYMAKGEVCIAQYVLMLATPNVVSAVRTPLPTSRQAWPCLRNLREENRCRITSPKDRAVAKADSSLSQSGEEVWIVP